MSNIDMIQKEAEAVDFGAVASMMCGEKLTNAQEQEVEKVKSQYATIEEIKAGHGKPIDL